jgi:lysophospholipid acyltransferase (LPLAT)-like uncharacterized protein
MGRKTLLYIAKVLFTIIAKTWRMEPLILPTEPIIVAFWHGGMLPCWYLFRTLKPVGIVSKSKDGEILSHLLEAWGYCLVRGSSSSGGSEVLQQMTKLASNGKTILITPDGPRGPKETFKLGAVIASQRSQAPILLVRPSIQSAYIFKKSWDKFSVPHPFTSIRFSTKKIEAISATVTPNEIEEIASECGNWLSQTN